ncbi:hypothetical protein FOA52_011376 [Chlamydomonas sp. UWO 241]|nr:hypothetical protein FOA52_011376 [Chlamydomonas sp. UWO 241]
MGAAHSSKAGTTRRKLGDAIQTHVFQRSLPAPLQPHEIEVLNKLAEREQARLSDLPSLEEINRKDHGLSGFLDKLSASISGRQVDVAGGVPVAPSGHASSSASGGAARHGARASLGLGGGLPKEDEDAGRLPSYLLRQALQARSSAAKAGGSFDVHGFANSVGVDGAKLDGLMSYACLPDVGKVETFGHQYAYARAPAWWRAGGGSGNTRKAEPWEKMIRPKAPEPAAEGGGSDGGGGGSGGGSVEGGAAGQGR